MQTQADPTSPAHEALDPPRASRPRVAFVVQRYGMEINGGSELLCRLVAERLAASHDVEVITTCARDYMTWRNEYPSGSVALNGVRVRRFAVDAPRNVASFDAQSQRVFSRRRSRADEDKWMRLQGPYSTGLLRFLQEEGRRYHAVVFFTYLYCTTYFGLPLVAERSVLVPTLHDEPSAYLKIFGNLFRSAARLVFQSEEERHFAERLFGLPSPSGSIAGIGLDVDAPVDATCPDQDWVGRFTAGRRTLLYLGRVDPSKGCGEMFDHYQRLTAEWPDHRTTLLVVGGASMPIPNHPDIVPAGFVSEQAKWSLVRSCDLLLLPSPYESLSIAALEAWSVGKPVLVNGRSKVLLGHCVRGNGGLWYRSYEQFRESVRLLLGERHTATALGAQGQGYVRQRCNWPCVLSAYAEAIESLIHPNLLGTRP